MLVDDPGVNVGQLADIEPKTGERPASPRHGIGPQQTPVRGAPALTRCTPRGCGLLGHLSRCPLPTHHGRWPSGSRGWATRGPPWATHFEGSGPPGPPGPPTSHLPWQRCDGRDELLTLGGSNGPVAHGNMPSVLHIKTWARLGLLLRNSVVTGTFVMTNASEGRQLP